MKGNIFELLNRKGIKPFGLEDNLSKRDDMIKASPSSPERGLFNPNKPMTTRPPFSFRSLPSMLRIMPPMMHNIRLSLSSLDQNPQQPKTEVDESFLTEFTNNAKSLGVGSVGYAKLPREYIFRGKAVLFDNVIILSIEMDHNKIAMAPSLQTQIMILRTYNDLGIVTNKLTDYLRQHGYAAQASHPLGGLTVYPPLGQLAGMGWHGSHGLLIIPEFGPRHRLAAIYTNITNLPITSQNSHAWVEDFCASCKRCIKACPSRAIYETPIMHDNGAKTHIDVEKCFPVFFKHHGCSICIKECLFNRKNYLDIKKSFEKGS